MADNMDSGPFLVHGGQVWIRALALDDLWEGEMVGLELGEADVLLVNLGSGDIRAYDNRCPHARARLSEGRLRGATLQCSAHHWEFDIRNGEGINPKNCRLRSFPVAIDGGAVIVLVGGARAQRDGDDHAMGR